MAPRTLSNSEIEAFREQICSVAGQLFSEQGYESVTMKAIAGELGVSPMTPYRYFANKGAIYREVRTRGFARFGARVCAAARAQSDPIKRLRAVFDAYLQFAIDEPGTYRIMFEFEAPADAQLEDEDMDHIGTTWEPLLDALDAAVSAGVVEGDPGQLANLCWVNVHGLASLQISHRLRFGHAYEDLVDPVFESLLHGISTRPEGDSK